MANPDVANILRLPGFFVKNPTTTTGGMPFGGTALGMSTGSEFRTVPRSKLITAEEFGGQSVAQIYCGETAIIATALRTFDGSAFSAIFPHGGDFNVSSGNGMPGTTLSTFKLMFCPLAYTYHPFVYFPAATGLPEESARLRMSLTNEIGFGVVFRAMPAADGCVYQIGTAGSITL